MPPEEEPTGVGTPLDRHLVGERLAVYCWANDVHSVAMLAECFAADAVWEGTVGDEHQVGPMCGRDRIVAWLSGFWPHQRDQRRHMVTDFAIEEIDADRALLLSYVLLTSAHDGEVTVVTTGYYRARMAREAEGWKIVELFGGFDAPFWPGKLERLSERGRRRHGLLGDPSEAG